MYRRCGGAAAFRIAERHPGLTGQPSFGLTFHLGFLPRASRRSARSVGVRNFGAAGYRITLSSCLRRAGGPADDSESVPLIIFLCVASWWNSAVKIECEPRRLGRRELGSGYAHPRNSRSCAGLADTRGGAPPSTHLPSVARRGRVRTWEPAGYFDLPVTPREPRQAEGG